MQRYGYGPCLSRSQSSSSEEDDGECQSSVSVPNTDNRSSGLVVVHLDVDAFYCQCEELRNPDLVTQPFAVGQKHIVVTCNYVARARGVKKLMLRTVAKEICPDLTIVEGSDLEPYRRQSRKIYASFRGAVLSLAGGADNLCKKGGMDEMYADISVAVRSSVNADRDLATCHTVEQDVFIYGNESTQVSICDDQSGAIARVGVSPCAGVITQFDRWEQDRHDRDACLERLHIGAKIAGTIRNTVGKETGFKACVGVSVSPMLSKLASELKKPNSLNVLYPWRCFNIMRALPLRKIPGLGSRTLQSLENCLTEYNPKRLGEDTFWTCGDLLQVPRSTVLDVCGDRLGDVLYQRCLGIDPVNIVDDAGGLAKTVSVEDSFKKGSVTTRRGVLEALKGLYLRLPRLLDDRRADSEWPDVAFPSTIRFTARLDDGSVSNKKLRFVTMSRQSTFNGRKLMNISEEKERSDLLHNAVKPLMEQLILDCKVIDVTKVNIAVTGFADIGLLTPSPETKQRSVERFFMAKVYKAYPNAKSDIDHSRPEKTQVDSVSEKRKAQLPSEELDTSLPAAWKRRVDPSFLAALPPDIRAEVEGSMQRQVMNTDAYVGNTKRSRRKVGTIESFFRKK